MMIYKKQVMIQKRLLVCLLICITAIKALAADPPYTSVLRGSMNQISIGATTTVQDTAFFDPVIKPTIQSTNGVLNVVQLRLNEFAQELLPDSFRVAVHLDITYSPISDPNTTYTISDSVLVVDYNKLKAYTAKDYLYFRNAVYVSVKIRDIQAQYAATEQVAKFLELENEILVDRDYALNCSAPAVTTISLTDTAVYRTGELTVYWTPNLASEEYDLEWTYIDNSALSDGRYNVGGTLNANLIFKHNATRVTIRSAAYFIPLLYEGGGKLFFRVRGAQYQLSGERKVTPWSSDVSTGLGQYVFTAGHEKNLNWQSGISFAEEGKRKAVVNYFDGALYNRQTVTKDNTTGTTVVGETLYDNQGRPQIQVLPTPTLSQLIKYTPKFNTLNSAEYDKDIYDAAGLICTPGAPPMDVQSGASHYYSPANPEKDKDFHKFIPNALGYVFSQTEYASDNTGRIARQGGVGKDHHLGSGHETQYYYGTPSQKELDALFGSEAGYAAHYQKTMIRDANGQYSVSYTDMKGRTIATALAGNSPATLQALSSNKTRSITDDLLDASNNVVKGTVIESVKTILVPAKGDYSFTYQLNPQSLELADCAGQNICYDCLYDLEITVTGECNNAGLPGGVPFMVTKNNFSLTGLDTTCTPAQPFSVHFDLFGLAEGSYQITKRLKLSEQKMAAYRDSLFLPHNTCKSYDDFYREALDSVLKRLGDCSNDSIATAAYHSYREQMLQDLTAPYGQYAKADPQSGCSFFSVLNIYQQPLLTYKGSDGEIALVTVMRDGVEVRIPPQQLTREEFIENFEPSWAESLLGYHPEYCLLEKFEKLAVSHTWDEAFEKTETYAEALSKGYLNPTADGRLPASKFGIPTADPLFSTLSTNGYGAQASDALAKLNAFLFDLNANGQGLTAWGFATAAAKCNETSDALIQSLCLQWTSSENAFNTAQLCTGELDMAWRVFRGLYLDKKGEWVDAFIRSGCTNYAFNYSTGDQPATCTPVFPKRDDLLQAGGLNLSAITSYQQAQQKGNEQLNALYDQSCREYAARWYEQLATCNYTEADKQAIIAQLIVVCKEGADEQHPFGASTVKPTSTSSIRSFDDVIRTYNAAHNIAYNAACNGYLIDLPKAWEGSAVMAVDQPLYARPDSCSCSRITQLYNEYNTNQSGYTSFSNYLQVRYKTTISDEDLNTLLGLCSGTLNCKFLERPITLPAALQCGANTCADCYVVKGMYQQYQTQFPDALPARLTEENEVQEQKNHLFERYLNSRLGFALTTDQYLSFIDSCQVGEVPVCDSTWTVFNPGQNLHIDNDFYLRSTNNISPYSQHFDGMHFVAPPLFQANHYVLVNKKTVLTTDADTALTIKWRVQVSNTQNYANAIAKTNSSTGTNTWVGAVWTKDPADPAWHIGTLVINKAGTISSLAGLGLSANAHSLKADWVRVYNSTGQLIYFDDFTATCGGAVVSGSKLCNVSVAVPIVSIEPDGPCADSAFLATIMATDRYRAYRDSLSDVFNNLYTERCLKAASLESFTVTRPVQEYHYTLYYYDQAGSLVKTIPPEGVDESIYSESGYFEGVKIARAAGTWKGPNHLLATTYRYNSLNQVVSQQSPDGGLSQFWYDRLGRLTVSQNAQQKIEGKYSYTLYDALGRITEVGQKMQATGMSQSLSRSLQTFNAWLYNGSGFEQVTRTVYDRVANLPVLVGSTAASFRQKAYTMRNRVSHTQFYHSLGVNAAGSPLYEEYTSGSYYSYDIHGSVDTLLHDYRTGMMAAHGVNRFKLLAYQYDLISGKVNQVHYQPGEGDQLYHRYDYDAENRLTDVYTTHIKEFVGQKNLEDHEAFYQYYKHGPLARTVLGQQQVQGVDHAYTLQGWLKGVNSIALSAAHDMGGDGLTGSANQNVARDAFGFGLNYFSGEYSAINPSVNPFPGHSGYLASGEYRPLYNGNIGSMAVSIGKLGETHLYNYRYDQLNRLVAMDAYRGFDAASNGWSNLTAVDDYKERVSYDANGNILSYVRNGTTAGGRLAAMDNLSYGYNKDINGRLLNNRLRHVKDDPLFSANYTEDIDTQTDDNYSYDAIGNLIQDGKEGINSITWTVYGKISSIQKADGTTIAYSYDAGGNRISKTVTKPGVGTTTTWYVRDAQGTVLAIYSSEGTTLSLSEQPFYGSSRLGVWNRRLTMGAAGASNSSSGIGAIHTTLLNRGEKVYELSNHLGNVLATLSDKKIGVDMNSDGVVDYYTADVTSAQDYYPFGMMMPGREFNNGNEYRQGQNGQEKSNEINKNSYTAEFWQYDSRIGRRWNTDPRPNVSISPYNTFAGNPIFFSDPLGDTTHYYSMKGKFLGGIYDDGTLKRIKVDEKMWNKVGGELNKAMGIKGKFENQAQRNEFVLSLNTALDKLEASGKFGDLISRETGVQNLTFTGSFSNKTHLASGILSLNSIFDNGSLLSINQWDALSGTVGRGGKILHPLPNRNDYIGTGIEGRPKGKGFDKFGVSYVLMINDFPVTSTWNRGLFRVHPDGNNPGSAGCIALQSGKDGLLLFKSLMQNYTRNHGNINIIVNISNNPNIGYIKENEKGQKKVNYGE
jgi:YD repeat-containing protein